MKVNTLNPLKKQIIPLRGKELIEKVTGHSGHISQRLCELIILTNELGVLPISHYIALADELRYMQIIGIKYYVNKVAELKHLYEYILFHKDKVPSDSSMYKLLYSIQEQDYKSISAYINLYDTELDITVNKCLRTYCEYYVSQETLNTMELLK